MNQWYLSKNGKAQGPLEESKIISLIQAGDVGHLDLVFRAGSSEWTPVSEVEEFSIHLKKSEPAVVASENDVEWVLLKKTKGEKKSQYTQLGPFSKNQVLDLIERGEIKFKDFGWRQGLEAWVPIGDIEEFNDPLPSTPKVDKEIYEAVRENTQVDEEAQSLTGLVEIEHFEHEKTQVMSASDIPLNSSGFATETGVDDPPVEDVLTEVPEESLQDTKSGFVEEVVSDHQTDADLWSLEPPDTSKEIKVLKKDKPKSKVRSSKKKTKVKKKSSSKTKKSPVGIRRPTVEIGESPWPWVAAACVLCLSVIFLYASFSGTGDEVTGVEKAPVDAEEYLLVKEDKIVEKNIFDNAPEVEEVREVKEVVNLQPSQDPQLSMGTLNDREISSAKKNEKNNEIVEEKVVKVKKEKRKKEKKKTKPRVVKKKRSSKKKTPAVATGSLKAKSFYKQRDRKALFYSSLKAEKLIVEIERNYKKLRKKKKSWKKFYSKWRRKAGQSALPRLVRKFPDKNGKYAYPRLIESFKRDHGLISKYGAVYNAKVLGLRRPAGAPKNVKDIFKGHKRQAQRLGR